MIGIIALLISILLPTLNSARESAKTTACKSNLRQVATATVMYINDNRSTLPGGRNFDWQNGDNPATPGVDGYVGIPFVDGPYIQDLLEKYLPKDTQEAERGINGVYRCPGVSGPEWLLEPGASNYRYNMDYAPGRRTSKFKNAVEAMIFYDLCWPDWKPEQYPHRTGNRQLINAAFRRRPCRRFRREATQRFQPRRRRQRVGDLPLRDQDRRKRDARDGRRRRIQDAALLGRLERHAAAVSPARVIPPPNHFDPPRPAPCRASV